MNIVSELKNDLSGILTIREMFGENRAPVPEDKATERAAICVECPQNAHGNWWEQSKEKLAETIKRHLEMKKQLLLRTKHDDQLHNCKVCGCVLNLLVWVTPEILNERTEAETLPSYPPTCWKRIELENL